MNLNEFIQLFAEQFDDTPVESFKPETNFKDLEEWSSLTALSIISVVDEEFDKQLTGHDLRTANTIQELFSIIQNK